MKPSFFRIFLFQKISNLKKSNGTGRFLVTQQNQTGFPGFHKNRPVFGSMVRISPLQGENLFLIAGAQAAFSVKDVGRKSCPE
jgi:hypothetical protein